MNNIDIIKQLDHNKKFLHEKDVQQELKAFVTNKNNPLDERFRVWSEHCDKKEERWIIHKGEYGIIGDMVDKCWPSDYDRYREYDYEDFLFWIEDLQDDEYFRNEWMREKELKNIRIPTPDEFKELLIETNFGSFTMDW